MSALPPPPSPDELAQRLVEIVQKEGGVIWKDKALTLLVRQEKIELQQARYALTQASVVMGSLEYAFGNENWYPATLRLTGESRSKPDGSSADTLEVPRDLIERCIRYAQTDEGNMIDAQRLKRILAGGRK